MAKLEFEQTQLETRDGNFKLVLTRNEVHAFIWRWEVRTINPWAQVSRGDGNMDLNDATKDGLAALASAKKLKKIPCPHCEGKGHL